jgi:hypothetical protein
VSAVAAGTFAGLSRPDKARRYWERRAERRCPDCGELAADERVRCPSCLDYHRAANARWAQRRQQARAAA